MQLKRALTLLTTATVTAAGLLALDVPRAMASDYCDYQDQTFPTVSGYGPKAVRVGLDPRLVTFSVNAEDNCGIAGWQVSNKMVFAYDKNPSETVYGFNNKDAGTTYMDVSVHDPAFNTTTKRFTFRLLRATRWRSVNAGPEPARKGGYVRVVGALERADWDHSEYRKYGSSGLPAKVQFKKKGAASWTTVKAVKIGKGARVSTRVRVTGTTAHDGAYRLSFGGNRLSGASASRSDYVRVE